VAVRVERKIWYCGWGNKPLGDNHTANDIATYQLTEGRLPYMI
jgi:hypothetical protein